MQNQQNKLLELYKYAEQQNITIDSFEMNRLESLAICRGENRFYVAINPRCLQSSADETVKAAHEIGHCVTGTLYCRSAEPETRRKCEVAADRWAIRRRT